jgi:hypothetical protein
MLIKNIFIKVYIKIINIEENNSMNKSKFLPVMALMLSATLMMVSNSKAAELAPGEGYFAGAFLGFGTGILQAKVTGNNAGSSTFETDRGGIGLSGIQGGGWTGWGMKTVDDIYFGAELSALGSEEQIELSSSKALSSDDGTVGGDISKIQVERNWSIAPALRLGYYVNKDTLFALKGGFAVSSFDVDIGSKNNTYFAGGPQMGGSVETRLSKIDPNLSLRMEFVYTNYLTASIYPDRSRPSTKSGAAAAVPGGHKNEHTSNALTGHDSAGRIGVQYSF